MNNHVIAYFASRLFKTPTARDYLYWIDKGYNYKDLSIGKVYLFYRSSIENLFQEQRL